MEKRDNKGRFIKGFHYNRATEFKKGKHWRKHKPFWEKEWLENEYLTKGRSTGDIAKQFNVKDASILFWAKKYGINRRSISEARKLKHWGLSGKRNGMYGRKGALAPSWKGGATPERQAFYHSPEWLSVAQQVWARDKGKCQRCKKEYRYLDRKLNKQNRTGFHIHHIVNFVVKELRAKLENLVLLCWDCHRWVHSKKNIKSLWIEKHN